MWEIWVKLKKCYDFKEIWYLMVEHDKQDGGWKKSNWLPFSKCDIFIKKICNWNAENLIK
jgi:hypothetical protein